MMLPCSHGDDVKTTKYYKRKCNRFSRDSKGTPAENGGYMEYGDEEVVERRGGSNFCAFTTVAQEEGRTDWHEAEREDNTKTSPTIQTREK